MMRQQEKLIRAQIKAAENQHIPEPEKPTPPPAPASISGTEASQAQRQQVKDEGQRQGLSSTVLTGNSGLLAPRAEDEEEQGLLG